MSGRLIRLPVPVQGAEDDAWDEFTLDADGFEDGPAWHRVAVHEEARDDPLHLETAPDGALCFRVHDPSWDEAHLAAFSTAVQVVTMLEAPGCPRIPGRVASGATTPGAVVSEVDAFTRL